MTLLLLALSGVLAGFINVMAGGGSLLTMPIMIFMGLPAQVVNGSNRVAILFQNIAAITAFRKMGKSDFRLSFTLSLFALPGVVCGALTGVHLEGLLFNRILGGIMIMVMILSAKSPRQKHQTEHLSTTRKVVGHLLMLGVGFYAGFIQAGVGFVLMAVLLHVMKLDWIKVNVLKVFIIGVSALISLIIFAGKGYVWWHVGLTLAVGNALGAWIGTHIAVKKGEHLIRIVFNVTLIVLALKLIFF